jgi:malonate decarboxylase acyl carrier protein
MPLERIDFAYRSNRTSGLDSGAGWDTLHVGFVGSGDLEILAKRLAGTSKESKIHITTSVSGYEELWKKVLTRFLDHHDLGGLEIWINDNGATPAVVRLRLEQLQLERRVRRRAE